MSDYGIFESSVVEDDAPQQEAKLASRKLQAAIYDVAQNYGPFLLAATGKDEFEDRWHYSKADIRKTVEPHIFPNTGTMRRVHDALKREYKRVADKTGPPQHLQQGREHSDGVLIPDVYNDPTNPETAGVQRDFGVRDGEDDWENTGERHASRVTLDLYTDWAKSNGLRVASLDSLEMYSPNCSPTEFRLIDASIRQAGEVPPQFRKGDEEEHEEAEERDDDDDDSDDDDSDDSHDEDHQDGGSDEYQDGDDDSDDDDGKPWHEGSIRRHADDEGDSGFEDTLEWIDNASSNFNNAVLNPFRSVGEGIDSFVTGDPYNAPNENQRFRGGDIGDNDPGKGGDAEKGKATQDPTTQDPTTQDASRVPSGYTGAGTAESPALPGSPLGADAVTKDTGKYDAGTGAWGANTNQNYINNDSYKAVAGDTLTNIGDRAYGPKGYETHKDEILKANPGISDPNKINIGGDIKLPGASRTNSENGAAIAPGQTGVGDPGGGSVVSPGEMAPRPSSGGTGTTTGLPEGVHETSLRNPIRQTLATYFQGYYGTRRLAAEEDESGGGDPSGGGGAPPQAPPDPAAQQAPPDPSQMGGAPAPLENQPAEDALLDTASQAVQQMMQRETQEYQQIMGPLNQAVQAIQFAQQVEQQSHPLDVTPPDGSVPVGPQGAAVPDPSQQQAPPGMPPQPPQQLASRQDDFQRRAQRIASTHGMTRIGYQMVLAAMNNRHYQEIAEAVSILPPKYRVAAAASLVNLFKDHNPHFKAGAFLHYAEAVPGDQAYGAMEGPIDRPFRRDNPALDRRYFDPESGDDQGNMDWDHYQESIRNRPSMKYGPEQGPYDPGSSIPPRLREDMDRGKYDDIQRGWAQDEAGRFGSRSRLGFNRGREASDASSHAQRPVLDLYESGPKGAVTPDDNIAITPNDIGNARALKIKPKKAKSLEKAWQGYTDKEDKSGQDRGDLDSFIDFENAEVSKGRSPKSLADLGQKIGLPATAPIVPKSPTGGGKTFKPPGGPKSIKPPGTSGGGSKHKANFFTRRVDGWKWNDHLAAYTSTAANPFTCDCGTSVQVPSYNKCRCGKVYNSYVIGAPEGEGRTAAIDMYLCREIAERPGMIMASRRTACGCDGPCSCEHYYNTVGVNDDTDWYEDEDLEDQQIPHAPFKNAGVDWNDTKLPGLRQHERHDLDYQNWGGDDEYSDYAGHRSSPSEWNNLDDFAEHRGPHSHLTPHDFEDEGRSAPVYGTGPEGDTVFGEPYSGWEKELLGNRRYASDDDDDDSPTKKPPDDSDYTTTLTPHLKQRVDDKKGTDGDRVEEHITGEDHKGTGRDKDARLRRAEMIVYDDDEEGPHPTSMGPFTEDWAQRGGPDPRKPSSQWRGPTFTRRERD